MSIDNGVQRDGGDGCYMHLARLLTSLHAAPDLPWLASRFEFVGERCIGADLSALVLRDERDSYRAVKVAAKRPSGVDAMWDLLRMEKLSENDQAASAFGQVARQGVPVRFRLEQVFPESAEAESERRCVVAQLSFEGEFMGVGLFVTVPNAETDAVAAILSEHAAVAVQRLRQHERARRLHGIDPRLWVPDEQYLHTQLALELNRLRRYGGEASVSWIRLDSAPELAARFGDFYVTHMLRRIGDQLTAAIRDTDVLAAFGGGFAVIFGSTPLVSAQPTVKRLCEAIGDMLAHRFPEIDLSLISRISAITVSAPRDGSTVQALLAHLARSGEPGNTQDAAA